MPDRLSINKELGIIEIYSYGELEVSDLENSREESIRISKEMKINKILVDASQLIKLPGTVQLYNFFSGFPRKLSLAIVISKDTQTEEILSFAETVAVNRGKTVKIFSNRKEALDWLLLGQ